MRKKTYLVYFIFTLALLYIISPWFFERYLFFNEVLSLTGFCILLSKRFKIGNDPVSLLVILLFIWGIVHAITSLFRFDTFYYYLRNTVITYSMMAFFIGYYWSKYLALYIKKIRQFLRVYAGIFIFIPVPRYIFERFGISMLFPALIDDPSKRWVPYVLVLTNIIYGITYNSLTVIMLAALYILFFLSPGIRFFYGVLLVIFVGVAVMFIYLLPNFDLIKQDYSFYDFNAITNVRKSNPILDVDGNTTWRLILWKEILVDAFPGNIFGLGFGTPAIKYYPVEDYNKLASLPYVMGAHNSFIYLFGRLGIVFLIIILPIYAIIIKEYFNFKTFYYDNKDIRIFWSFFAITVIALFNPALESPIYASAYWLILGLLARSIYYRRSKLILKPSENITDP